jgi:hypothetical protein
MVKSKLLWLTKLFKLLMWIARCYWTELSKMEILALGWWVVWAKSYFTEKLTTRGTEEAKKKKKKKERKKERKETRKGSHCQGYFRWCMSSHYWKILSSSKKDRKWPHFPSVLSSEIDLKHQRNRALEKLKDGCLTLNLAGMDPDPGITYNKLLVATGNIPSK